MISVAERHGKKFVPAVGLSARIGFSLPQSGILSKPLQLFGD